MAKFFSALIVFFNISIWSKPPLIVNGRKISSVQLERAYSSYLKVVSQFVGRDVETLREIAKKSKKDVEYQQIASLYHLRKDDFFERYQIILLAASEAKKEKIDSKPQTKAFFKFLVDYHLAGLYFEEKTGTKKYNPTKAEVQSRVLGMRKSPAYSSVPLDSLLTAAKKKLREEWYKGENEKIRKKLFKNNSIRADIDSWIRKSN